MNQQVAAVKAEAIAENKLHFYYKKHNAIIKGHKFNVYKKKRLLTLI